MERVYKAIVTGPKEYLARAEGVLVERFEITQEDIDEYLSEGDEDETEEDAINYYKEEYEAEWAQRWCKVTFLTEDQIDELDRLDSYNLSEDDEEDEDDEDEDDEEEEEDE